MQTREPQVRFSPAERRLVAAALSEAEGLVGRFYCIPPRGWQRLPYDVLTQGEEGSRPLPGPVLAETVHLERTSRTGATYDFYRIQLNDSGILALADREDLSGELRALLSYVLAHEMVHLVRLGVILDRSGLPHLGREAEEERVERICRQALGGSSDPAIHGVLARLAQPPGTGGWARLHA